jgi:branched-subunit amino acid transport protein
MVAGVSDSARLWAVILGLGAGTYLIRFSFIGLVGDRQLPEWTMRLLRYVPVAVMPALVAPLVMWPQATGGAPDPARLAAALAALAFGAWRRSMLGAIAAGLVVLYIGLWVVG